MKIPTRRESFIPSQSVGEAWERFKEASRGNMPGNGNASGGGFVNRRAKGTLDFYTKQLEQHPRRGTVLLAATAAGLGWVVYKVAGGIKNMFQQHKYNQAIQNAEQAIALAEKETEIDRVANAVMGYDAAPQYPQPAPPAPASYAMGQNRFAEAAMTQPASPSPASPAQRVAFRQKPHVSAGAAIPAHKNLGLAQTVGSDSATLAR